MYVSTASVAGNAKCEFGEIWKNGRIAKKLLTRMKTKSVVR
jgi:hypothetical protein